jgi:hypothetical protein
MDRVVHVAHCIDTEGPLHESLAATFERLRTLFGLDLPPDAVTLRRLQAGAIDLGGREAAVQAVCHPRLLAYNDTWDRIDAMLADCMSRSFRTRSCDSFGGGWIYNWFCVDHVDYEINPRRRDLGIHNVFDHYRRLVEAQDPAADGLHFHFHPHAFRKEAHLCATHWWANSPHLFQILSRRVIDRLWFPAAHRPGFHVIRPESHWFLEQHVPFDYASQALRIDDPQNVQSGLSGGRFGDWRRAPVNWQPYHPDHDDYQVPGRCRRWVARCLNVGTRFGLLTETDVRQAFQEAADDKPVLLAVTNHDFRDLRPDVNDVRRLLARVAADHPGIGYRFCEAVDGFRRALKLPAGQPCELAPTVTAVGDAAHVLEVASPAPTFGPQPWLALRTTAGTYHHNNFEIVEPFHRWRYVFDAETFPLGALSDIGIAANNPGGVTTVAVLEVATGKTRQRLWHDGDSGTRA